jgi:hypothetical protein
MDPISIDNDEYDASSDDMEFDNVHLLAPVVDDVRIGQSGREPRTLSDSNSTSDASSDADEDVDGAQRMDIDAPHTIIPGTRNRPHNRRSNHVELVNRYRPCQEGPRTALQGR